MEKQKKMIQATIVLRKIRILQIEKQKTHIMLRIVDEQFELAPIYMNVC